MQYIINTREDLDSIKTRQNMINLCLISKGQCQTMWINNVYPENYNTTEYSGEKLEPIREEVEDLTTITRFGFKKSDFQGMK